MSETFNRIRKLGLGTVQFGLDYGISNRGGQTPESEVRRILTTAHEAGIRTLDTAAMYGESERVLGATMPAVLPFRIITKTTHFNSVQIGFCEAEQLKNTFYKSIENIRRNRIYGLMIHNADDLLANGGELLYEAMTELKLNGLVDKIGVSVYGASQIDKILPRYSIDLIQVPVNLFDQRLVRSGHLVELKNRDIEIHARSAFLQGALLMEPEELPEHFDPVRKHLQKFRSDCESVSVSPLTACLDYLIGIKEIDCVVVGVCSVNHLSGILMSTASGRGLADYEQYAWQDETILNPALWRKQNDEQNIKR